MKKTTQKSLNSLFTQSFVKSFLIPLILIGAFFLYFTLRFESEKIADSNEVFTSNISRIISVYLHRGRDLLTCLVPLLPKDSNTFSEETEAFLDGQSFSTIFDYIYLLDSTGTTIWATALNTDDPKDRSPFTYSGITYKNKEFFKKVVRDQVPVWSETYTSLISGERTVTIILPVPQGYVAGNIDMRRLVSVIKSLKISKNLSFFILDKYGNYIYHPDENNLYKYSKISQQVHNRLKKDSLSNSFTFYEESHLFLASSAGIDESSWHVIVSMSYIDAMGSVIAMGLLLFLLIITVMILALRSSWNMSSLINKSLEMLQKQADSVANGAYDIRDIETEVVEFKTLNESVNAMAEAVHSRESKIREAQEVAEEQLQFQQTLIDTIAMPLFVKNHEEDILLTNQSCKMLLGTTARELLPLLTKQEQTVMFKDGTEHTVVVTESLFARKDGVEHSVVIITDLTERLKLEARMNHAERLQAIGKLAGGIAHDVNNQLAGIMGFSEILKSELEEEELIQYVDSIMEAVSQSADITRQLLAFARQGKYSMKALELGEIITGVRAMLTHTISKQIAISIEKEPGEHWITGDKSQIQNAILNLGINARDAIGPQGGTIRFILTSETVPTPRKLFNETLDAGNYFKLTVCDSGTGIEPHLLDHIFDPFFTTKEEGKGTGMGLAAVFGTVSTHKGAITVDSTPGKGACFQLYFPQRENNESEKKETVVKSETSGEGTVLLVDDEQVILLSVSRLLEKRGYTVITAANGREALEEFSKNPSAINAVVLDANMPVMNGYDTFHALREITPTVPIIIATGYAEESHVQELVRNGQCDYINKPYQISVLVEHIAKLTKA